MRGFGLGRTEMGRSAEPRPMSTRKMRKPAPGALYSGVNWKFLKDAPMDPETRAVYSRNAGRTINASQAVDALLQQRAHSAASRDTQTPDPRGGGPMKEFEFLDSYLSAPRVATAPESASLGSTATSIELGASRANVDRLSVTLAGATERTRAAVTAQPRSRSPVHPNAAAAAASAAAPVERAQTAIDVRTAAKHAKRKYKTRQHVTPDFIKERLRQQRKEFAKSRELPDDESQHEDDATDDPSQIDKGPTILWRHVARVKPLDAIPSDLRAVFLDDTPGGDGKRLFRDSRTPEFKTRDKKTKDTSLPLPPFSNRAVNSRGASSNAGGRSQSSWGKQEETKEEDSARSRRNKGPASPLDEKADKLRDQLPGLFATQAYKAFLRDYAKTSAGASKRMPPYLHGVRPADDRTPIIFGKDDINPESPRASTPAIGLRASFTDPKKLDESYGVSHAHRRMSVSSNAAAVPIHIRRSNTSVR